MTGQASSARAFVVITSEETHRSCRSIRATDARRAVPIYGIGTGIKATEVDVRYQFGRFSGETGGNVYYIDRAEDVHRIYADIRNELRSQYILGISPPKASSPAQNDTRPVCW